MIFRLLNFRIPIDDPSSSNSELEAIRALQYEGTPTEIAQNFREQGNEMARVKRWRDAKEYYTKALDALRDTGKKARDDASPNEGGKDEKRIKEIEEACYSNRALCNLSLRKYYHTLPPLLPLYFPRL